MAVGVAEHREVLARRRQEDIDTRYPLRSPARHHRSVAGEAVAARAGGGEQRQTRPDPADHQRQEQERGPRVTEDEVADAQHDQQVAGETQRHHPPPLRAQVEIQLTITRRCRQRNGVGGLVGRTRNGSDVAVGADDAGRWRSTGGHDRPHLLDDGRPQHVVAGKPCTHSEVAHARLSRRSLEGLMRPGRTRPAATAFATVGVSSVSRRAPHLRRHPRARSQIQAHSTDRISRVPGAIHRPVTNRYRLVIDPR